ETGPIGSKSIQRNIGQVSTDERFQRIRPGAMVIDTIEANRQRNRRGATIRQVSIMVGEELPFRAAHDLAQNPREADESCLRHRSSRANPRLRRWEIWQINSLCQRRLPLHQPREVASEQWPSQAVIDPLSISQRARAL